MKPFNMTIRQLRRMMIFAVFFALLGLVIGICPYLGSTENQVPLTPAASFKDSQVLMIPLEEPLIPRLSDSI